MFASKFVGKKKQIEVATRKTEEMVPLRIDQRPRFHGPCTNLSLETVIRRMIGIAYDVE